VGSPAVAAFIGYWIFWILLVYGVGAGELSLKRAAAFLVLWVAGRIGLAYVPWEPAHGMFSSFVAILDIALVFAIFRGDIRLT